MRYILFMTYVDYYILIRKLLENIVKKKRKENFTQNSYKNKLINFLKRIC